MATTWVEGRDSLVCGYVVSFFCVAVGLHTCDPIVTPEKFLDMLLCCDAKKEASEMILNKSRVEDVFSGSERTQVLSLKGLIWRVRTCFRMRQ